MQRIQIGCVLIALASLAAACGTKGKDFPYRGRAVLRPGFFSTLKADAMPLRVLNNHGTESDRVLLIRDHLVLDHPDFDSYPARLPATGKWTFASIMKLGYDRARSTSGLPASTAAELQSITDDWLRSVEANHDLNPAIKALEVMWKQPHLVDRMPVRLLAIVNRIDLAQPVKGCAATEVGNAEIRFDFAGIYPPSSAGQEIRDEFRMIIEFVLPCLSTTDGTFKGLATDWQGLAGKTGDDYRTALEALLAKWLSQSQTARLRLAGQLNGPWAVQEYAFDSLGMKPGNLERELISSFPQCQEPGSDLGKFARGPDRKDILASTYQIQGALATQRQVVEPRGTSVLTLAPDGNLAGTGLDDLRHILSINTCRGCHSLEASVGAGVHLGYRRRGADSVVSAFLSGQKDCTDSVNTSNTEYCQVQPKPVANCNGQPAPQSYNDLLRRHQYLDAVLNSTSAPGTPDWFASLSRYRAQEVH